jgi:hypothetical protein
MDKNEILQDLTGSRLLRGGSPWAGAGVADGIRVRCWFGLWRLIGRGERWQAPYLIKTKSGGKGFKFFWDFLEEF